jgi:hypothetical protein
MRKEQAVSAVGGWEITLPYGESGRMTLPGGGFVH